MWFYNHVNTVFQYLRIFLTVLWYLGYPPMPVGGIWIFFGIHIVVLGMAPNVPLINNNNKDMVLWCGVPINPRDLLP